MTVRFAINGAGRMGRALIRIATRRPELELVAVNDLASCEQLATLLARDTIHGRFPGDVSAGDGCLVINGRAVAVSCQPDLGSVPWLGHEPVVVVDATGKAKTRQAANLHRRGPVQKVLVSANAEGMDLTLCLGVNQDRYDPGQHHLISAASCTTNCLAPLVWVLLQNFGLEHAFFSTVHSYNNDQRLLSYPHTDPRRARAAALNMIPTTTSANHAILRILPQLEGRIDGFAVRVPTPNVSLVDLVAALEETPTVEEVNRAFEQAAAGALEGILATTEEELVSSDFMGDPHSAIVDLPLTRTVDGGLYRIVAWYDNEWGHASRLADCLALVGKSLPS